MKQTAVQGTHVRLGQQFTLLHSFRHTGVQTRCQLKCIVQLFNSRLLHVIRPAEIRSTVPWSERKILAYVRQ